MPGGKHNSRSPSTRGRSRDGYESSRSYSRSPSRRSRSRSYSDYSDSFYSDDSYNRSRKRPPSTRNTNKSSSSTAYKNTVAKPKKKPIGKKTSGTTKNSSKNTKGGGAVSPRNMEYVTRRMLSARRIKINELKNEIEDQAKQLSDLHTENRTLRRDKHLREKQLDKYEYQENDMSNVLSRHSSEVRVLKETIRKNKEKNQKLEHSMKQSEEELERTKKLLKKMKGLVEDKELAERDELARKLSKAEALLDEKDKRVRDLERHVENLTKNHKHEMGIERARHKESNKQLLQLQDKYDQIQIQLREKEKEIEAKNIYANRLMKPPHHSSISSSPAPTRERRSVEPEMTPRDKAKMFEQKRREEQRKKKEEQEKKDTEMRRKREEREREEREKLDAIERERREREDEMESQKREEREWRERKERERKEREDRERREKEDEERRRRREEEEEERKWKEERDRRKREAEELFSKQKRDKEERERRENEAQERRDREERERAEVERRAQAERHKLDTDQAENERKRQKELLLAKMKAIDDGPAKAEKDSELFSISKDKPPVKGRSHGDATIFGSAGRHKKDYSFSKPIENMHSGKPSHEKSSRRKPLSLFDSDDSDAGYNPSFGTARRGNTKTIKKDSIFDDSPTGSAGQSHHINGRKNDLMTNLFGTSTDHKPSAATDTTKDLEFTFSTSPKKTPAATRKENSTTQIYGGGSAFLEDEDQSSGKGNGLLPRRLKQPSSTIHNRPTVNAVDSFEDEIEEVIL